MEALADVAPVEGSRNGWSYKSYKRIGAAEIPTSHPGPDGRKDRLYGVYGVRNNGQEVLAQYEGHRHLDGSISGVSLLSSSMDLEAYLWHPADRFAKVTIFERN